VLNTLVQIIKKRLRETGIFAGWGGDELMILLPATGAKGAEELAEKLRIKVMNHELRYWQKTDEIL
jgi:GGDEF domain-containing protein